MCCSDAASYLGRDSRGVGESALQDTGQFIVFGDTLQDFKNYMMM